MNKPIVLRTADIYLRFPEIMEEECNDLAEFLEDEHIVYEGATDVFIEKDKEIERLNNQCEKYKKIATQKQYIIEEIEKDIKDLYTYGIKNNSEQKDYLLNRLEGLKEVINNEFNN